jgi:predicted lipoprotein
MRRAIVSLCVAVVAGVVVWIFPLFHVVRNENGVGAKEQSDSNAAESANTFWNSQLIPALKQAPDAAIVLTSLRENDKSAREKFGRKIGVSRTSMFVVRGIGKIVWIDKQGVGVAVAEDSQDADVVLQTGLVFGNIVRDATGLLDTSAFSDSRQLNEVSAELNRMVETRVVQKLKDTAKVGRQVSFAGCAEIPDDASDTRPLTIIPLVIQVE